MKTYYMSGYRIDIERVNGSYAWFINGGDIIDGESGFKSVKAVLARLKEYFNEQD
jgi:hypothetical protein